jgi:DNA-binding beta-propeller fold protein YncE
LEKKYGNLLVVLGVHTPKFDYEKGLDAVRKAAKRYKLNHPSINDADRKIWNAYGVQSWPTLVLIDPEGYFVGGLPSEHAYEQFDKAISYLIRVHKAKGTLNTRGKAVRAAHTPEKRGPLYYPGKVRADAKGNRLFIADSTGNRVVITDLAGKKLAVAGTGAEGKADGPFDRATFHEPQGMALVGETLYVADRANHLIRALDLKGQTVKTVAGTGRQAVYPPSDKDKRGGSPLKIALNSPWDVLALGDSLYIAMAGHHQIWKLNLTQHFLSPFAGSAQEEIADGPRLSAHFAQPSGLATDGKTLWVADSETSSIRAVPLAGMGRVRTLVGSGLFVWGDQDGAFPQVKLQHPLGVIYHDHKLYVADTFNSKIKVLDPAARTSTTLAGGNAAGEPLFDEPGGLSYANGKLYVADTNAHRIRVVDLRTREVTTLPLEGVEAPKVSSAR